MPGLSPTSGLSANGVTYATDAFGNITGLAGNGGPLMQDFYANRAPLGFALVTPPVSGITTATGASCTVNTSAATIVNGETVWQVTATASASSNNWFEVNVPLQSQSFSGSDMTIEFMVDDMSKIYAGGGGVVCYMGTSSYSTFANASITSQLTPSTTASHAYNNAFTAYQIHETLWTKSGFTDSVGNQAWVNCKLRVFVTNGQTITFTLRAIRFGAFRRKARLAIVADDGHLSWWQMGVPILREYGFVSSAAIIYDILGNSGYMTLAQCKEYAAEGNECIPHGPNSGNGGQNNMFNEWSTNAQRLADMNACRDYLLSNGLCTQWGARTYIWPQGVFCSSTSDLSMLTVMQAAGYKVARGVFVPTNYYYHKTQGISAVNLMPFNLPVLGHTWTSAGAEAANIASINARIAAVSAARADCCVMFHRVVGVDAAAQGVEISSNRFREILDAIKAEVDSGNMDVVLYSEYAK